MLKRLIIYTLLSTLITVLSWTLGIFFSGIDFILLPLMIVLVLIGVSGIITIPLGLYKYLRKKHLSKALVVCMALSMGYFLGGILEKPVHKWDEQQRNTGGLVLTTEIENFKTGHGFYPTDLNQLNVDKLSSGLPKTYQLNKFSYHKNSDSYDLYIIIPIFDRWHWNKEKQQFIYDDF